jgi:hypothetical protein
MALRSLLRLRRREPEPPPRFDSRMVLILYTGDQTALRLDLPMTIEEEGHGLVPLVAYHNDTFDTPMQIDGISVEQRHQRLDG